MLLKRNHKDRYVRARRMLVPGTRCIHRVRSAKGWRWAVALALAVLLPWPLPAAIRTWKADTSGDWSDPSNWVEGSVPLAGDDVVITNVGAVALLTDATPVLGSLIVSRTLVATNWTTIITVGGEIRILDGGIITTPAVFFNNSESNRVHLVCVNLTVESGGQINVNEKGFGGGWNSAGQGLGAGDAAAGYGGRGGDLFSSFLGGPVYGNPAAPTGPGSGGRSTDGRGGHQAGHGGGAVRIEATGHVLVNGTISANGGAGAGYSGPGSGGAIWVICRTFGGTNGVVRAEGRDRDRGGGGGGRIAIEYDPLEQALLPVPSVTFSTRGGRTTSGGRIQHGDIGSLYFPDRQWIGPLISHAGQLNFAGAPTVLTFDTLTVSNGWIRFVNGVESITVSNDLVVQGTAGRLDVGGSRYYTARGPWRLNNTAPQATTLTVGGDVVLRQGGAVWLVAAPTNGTTVTEGVIMNVTGDLMIAADSWLYPLSSATNGGSPLVTCADLTIAAGGGIHAVAAGFAGGLNSGGMGPGAVRYGGAGHGGRGGGYSSVQPGRGPVCGSAQRPAFPGSGGGSADGRRAMIGGYGGGLVRMAVAGRFTLDGMITASAGINGDGFASAGSGGAILIDCRHFDGAVGGMLRAAGANIGFGGGGGGGRIAVWYGDRLTYAGDFDVAGGTGGYENGEAGTVTLIDVGPVVTNHPAAGIIFTEAWLMGELLATGGAPTAVTVYWGPADGATDKAAWYTNETYVAADIGAVSNHLTGLSAATQYYYRYYATNAFGAKWAPETTSFSTLGAPTVDNGIGPTAIRRTSATLNGDVIGGNPSPWAYFCWGTADGGAANPGAWENVIVMGERLGPFETSISNLEANQTYYYRCYATNGFGDHWSPVTTNFTTPPPALKIADVAVIEGPSAMTTAAVFPVVLSDPSALDVKIDFATADGTATAGFDYVATNGTLIIPAGSMAGSITVTVLGDAIDEYPSEYFWVNLTNGVNAVFDIAGDEQAVGTIWDDDDIAEIKHWNGVGSWTHAAHWTPPGMPSPSDTVIIESGTVTLDAGAMIEHPVFGGADAVAVAALTVSNAAVLVKADWSTRLVVVGDVTVRDIAVITTPVPSYNSDVTNRVHIGCANLTVTANARVDVNARGYGGGWAGDGSTGSWRRGRGPGGSFTAGSYGGRGAGAGVPDNWRYAAAPYGAADMPTGPGSGGGSTDGRSGHQGGHGGGAVRIEATGHVRVDGTISANGGPRSGNSSPGSGGAVWISCRTLDGAGVISADGPDGPTGGGGGRLAIDYDPAVQVLIPAPAIRLSARGGTSTARDQGDLGTVYLPDRALLASPIRHSGQLFVPGYSTAMTFDTLTISNGWIRFNDGGFVLTVSNDVTVSGGRLEIGANQHALQLAAEKWFYNRVEACPVLAVGGDLTLTQGGGLVVCAGATNTGVGEWGARVEVAGDFLIEQDSWFYPVGNPTNGGAVYVACRNLRVTGDNAGIAADERGFAGGWNGRGYGPGGERRGGAGHGGRGGGYSAAFPARGAIYGDDMQPRLPGSGGGSTDSRPLNNGGHGGGLIRIDAADAVEIAGILTATGGNQGNNYSSAGSGGAILIHCRELTGGATAALRVAGGIAGSYGGGGGGRIAVYYGDRYRDDLPARRVLVSELPPPTYSGATNAGGGSGGYQSGEDGSITFVRVIYPAGVVLSVR